MLLAGFLGACPSGRLLAGTGHTDGSVLDVFPVSDSKPSKSAVQCSFSYQSSGSEWTPGVDEKQVFLASIETEKWRLGIGKGGQIYSLRGPYGESVPPQRKVSPWNDEVWQLVATSESLAVPIQDYQIANPGSWSKVYPLLYFVHQSGIYIDGDGIDGGEAPVPFYSPCLRKDWNPDTKTLQMVNWMQQARSPCVWKSELLVYTSYRDIGGGAIEATQVLHNFGTLPVDYLSSPWGGVRKTSLPQTVISKTDGTWAKAEGTWGWQGNPMRSLPETGGWAAWVRDASDDNSPALALAFGSRNMQSSAKPASMPDLPNRIEGARYFLWGTSGDGRARDYEVAEQATKIKIGQGESVAIRWYLVSGNFAEVRATAAKLAEKAYMERLSFKPDVLQAIHVQNGKMNTNGDGERWGALVALPADGCVPVFLLTDKKTGKQTVTADIYTYSPSAPLINPLPESNAAHTLYQNRVHHSQYEAGINYDNLLGFAFKEGAGGADAKPLTAPDGVKLHDSAKNLRMLP